MQIRNIMRNGAVYHMAEFFFNLFLHREIIPQMITRIFTALSRI